MEMLLEIRDEDKVGEYVKDRLGQGKKIPGFGHRIYKGEDPRVSHLRSLSRSLCQRTNNEHWFELSAKVEEAVSRERDLHPNMDFYSATLYYALGIPVDMLTTMFACSRMAGWTGHIIEQYELNRLIRPLGDYVGDLSVEYVPIEKRN
jgi:citrate synthase